MGNLCVNWERYVVLLNMGHMIYVLDQILDVNSMAVCIL